MNNINKYHNSIWFNPPYILGIISIGKSFRSAYFIYSGSDPTKTTFSSVFFGIKGFAA